MKTFKKVLAISALTLGVLASASSFAADKIKIGFLVKQAEEPWFQTEWRFADEAGKKLGAEIVKIAVPDGEKTLNAIDTLAAQGAQGFIICTPDPKLGPAILAKAKSYGLKVMAVDDQFVDAKGQFMSVPTVMMAASEIGELQGKLNYEEMIKRGWDVKTTAVMVITSEELDTARRRTEGSISALKAAGFPATQIYKVPTKSNDIPGALDAANSLLVQHPEVKQWIVVGMNDNTVLGGIRATEGQGFNAQNTIGIGINGTDAINELQKKEATGFYGSIMPSPDVHGAQTVESMYEWITKGTVPPEMNKIIDATLITRENFAVELKKKGLL